MIVDGEKVACEACIRGHRVARCQHTDRPLQPIGGKGRPVSQCQHCRTLRKSHSVHTRCKCAIASRCSSKQPARDRCRCCEGEACICAVKKDRGAGTPDTGTPDTGASPVSTATPSSTACHQQTADQGLSPLYASPVPYMTPYSDPGTVNSTGNSHDVGEWSHDALFEDLKASLEDDTTSHQAWNGPDGTFLWSSLLDTADPLQPTENPAMFPTDFKPQDLDFSLINLEGDPPAVAQDGIVLGQGDKPANCCHSELFADPDIHVQDQGLEFRSISTGISDESMTLWPTGSREPGNNLGDSMVQGKDNS